MGTTIDLHGGGADLIFPHHECEAAQSEAATGEPLVRHWAHQAMVRKDGEKMSKSLGNLEFVFELAKVWHPMAIRLGVLAHHYRTEWEWTDADLHRATQRLAGWRTALSGNGGAPAGGLLAKLRERVADDLDTPGALAVVDAWAVRSLELGGTELGAPGLVARAIDRLLGVRV